MRPAASAWRQRAPSPQRACGSCWSTGPATRSKHAAASIDGAIAYAGRRRGSRRDGRAGADGAGASRPRFGADEQCRASARAATCSPTPAAWDEVLGVNLLGVLNGVQAFVPAMIDGDAPALIINTGSKQGITQPPGNTAYNVSKAGVKALTEGLAHTLAGTHRRPGERASAHSRLHLHRA